MHRHYQLDLSSEAGNVFLSFLSTSSASVLVGVAAGLLSALFMHSLGMGERGELPHIEALLFWVFAYGSFVCAEMPHMSGIVAAMFCGCARASCTCARQRHV